MIQKKQKKKGMPLGSEADLKTKRDPFEELNRYLEQPRLRRNDCPNPIPWWGVCHFHYSTVILFKNLNVLF